MPGDRIPIGYEDEDPEDGLDDELEFDDDEPDLGPDERDMDLLDGSWEQDYYAGRQPTRNWNAITVGLALLILMGLVLPALLVFFN